MEAHASANEQLLIDGLSFKLKPGANYVTNRRSVTFHPQGSNIYKTQSGTKVLKIVLNSNDWLDPSTVRLMFDVKNTDATAGHMLRTISGPWSFWRRLRIMCGGTLIEDFDYSKTHELYCTLKPKEQKQNDNVEGFGYNAGTMDTHNRNTMPGIAPNSYRTVSMNILSGVLNQPKFLPLRYMSGGLSFEFELCSDILDPIAKIGDAAVGGTSPFTAADTSQLWEIENCQIKADVLTLDNSLENSYHEHIMSGKPLPINYNTFITSNQAVSGTNVSISVSRAVTRLKGMFITLYKNSHTDTYEPFNKEWAAGYHPMLGGGGSYNSAKEIEYQIQLGAKLYPEYPVRSVAEAFAQLRKTVGLNYGHHAIDLTAEQYNHHKFIIGVDMEKISEMGFTGENTMNGQLMVVKYKALGGGLQTGHMPDQINLFLNSDQIMEIKDVGVTVLD